MGWRVTSEHYLNSLTKSLTRNKLWAEKKKKKKKKDGKSSLSFHFHQDEKCCKGKSISRPLLKKRRGEGGQGPSPASSHHLFFHPALPAWWVSRGAWPKQVALAFCPSTTWTAGIHHQPVQTRRPPELRNNTKQTKTKMVAPTCSHSSHWDRWAWCCHEFWLSSA